MVTILLVNLVGVAIYVSGTGMCIRATKRTGNNGYLLLAAYFAAALVVSSLDQVRDLERGPDPEMVKEAMERLEKAPAPAEAKPVESAEPDATAAAAAETAEKAEAAPAAEAEAPADKQAASAEDGDTPPPPIPDFMPTASLPILPALLLVGVFLVSRDDPRRRRAEEGETGEARETQAEK